MEPDLAEAVDFFFSYVIIPFIFSFIALALLVIAEGERREARKTKEKDARR